MIKITLRRKRGWWIFAKTVKSKMSIPSSWGDITFKQWKDLHKTDDSYEMAAILSGMTIQTIRNLSEQSFAKMSSILSFVNNPMKMNEYKAPSKIVINNELSIPLVEDIREKTFGQKLYLHQVLQDSGEDFTEFLPDIILTYAQPYIDNSKFDLERLVELRTSFDDLFLLDLYSTAMNYVLQLKKIIQNEGNTLQSTPTTEQVQAGIHMFQEFGVMNTVKALAGSGPDWALHIDNVMELEYNIALLSMQMSKTQKIFEENYRKILKNKP